MCDVFDPDLTGGVDLGARRRPELGLHPAAEAAERGGRENGLARPADADRQVVVRAADRRRDRGGDGSVPDQLDPRARATKLLDQIVMPRPVENERGDVERLASEALGDLLDVFRDRAVQVDHTAGARADGDRAHVHLGQPAERALGGDRQHGHGAYAAARDDAAPLDRVERQVDAIAAGADPPARLERLAGPCPEDDLAVDRKILERGLHRARGSVLGRLLVGAAEPACAGERRPFGRLRVAGAEAIGHRCRC